MTTVPTTQPVPVPIKPRRRRWRVILVSLAILIAAVAGFWGYLTWSTRTAWADAAAEAERDLPRFRLLELEADRPNIPDEENSALFMMALRRKGGGAAVSGAPNYEKIFENLPPTAQLNKQQSELIRKRLALIGKNRAEARKLKDMPRGRYPITYTDDAIGTLIPHHQEARGIAEWLQHDAYLLAHDEEFDKAVESCQAILVAGRAFEGDAFLVAFLIRKAMQNISMSTLERTLAQGEPGEESLRVMQAAIGREIKDSSWLHAIRGERAMIHHLFSNIRDGKIQMPRLMSVMGGLTGGGPGPGGIGFAEIEVWLADRYPAILLKYYPESLHQSNRIVEISKLPIHERVPKIIEWSAEEKKSRNPIVRLFTPALQKVHNAEVRSQAMLRSAMVALACERYRLKHEKHDWPASLDVLAKEKLLDEIPTDPMDNQPIRYRRTKEGIVIYSIGLDGVDNQGNLERNNMSGETQDIGFRLWNIGRRRQTALPLVVIFEGEGR